MSFATNQRPNEMPDQHLILVWGTVRFGIDLGVRPRFPSYPNE